MMITQRSKLLIVRYVSSTFVNNIGVTG